MIPAILFYTLSTDSIIERAANVRKSENAMRNAA